MTAVGGKEAQPMSCHTVTPTPTTVQLLPQFSETTMTAVGGRGPQSNEDMCEDEEVKRKEMEKEKDDSDTLLKACEGDAEVCSDSECTDYEDEDDMHDYYDDDDDYGEEEENQSQDQELNETILQDIQKARELFGDNAVEITSANGISSHVVLHLPCREIDVYTVQAWNINKEENISIEMQLNMKTYPDTTEPKVDVKSSKGVNALLAFQLKNILQSLVKEKWSKRSDASIVQDMKNVQLKDKHEQKEDLAAKKVPCPSQTHGFLAMVLTYVKQRLSTLNRFCAVCDKPLESNSTIKPTICKEESCNFTFSLMPETAKAQAVNVQVAELLLAMAKAACVSPRRKDIFIPFHCIVDSNHSQKISPKYQDYARCEKALFAVPEMENILNLNSTELKRQLDAQDELAYPSLLSLVDSYRFNIVHLAEHAQLDFMKTKHQFLLTNLPHKQTTFTQAKEKYGTTFAFHGSNIGNWHSIIRNGLIKASGTKLQANGARYGRGIYLSPESDVSAIFASTRETLPQHPPPRKQSDNCRSVHYDSDNLCCLALCEVVKKFRKAKDDDGIWIVSNPDHVAVRFLFLWENGICAKGVDTQDPDVNELILKTMSIMNQD